jgi:hypothetical protein
LSKSRSRIGKTASLGNEIAACFNKVPSSYRQTFSLQAVWEEVAAQNVLDHTDNVIYDKKSKGEGVVVFVDSAQWAAELNMQREYYRIVFTHRLGKEIESVKFFVSKNTGIRKNFQKLTYEYAYIDDVEPVPMDENEEYIAQLLVDDIDDQKLKEKVFKALKADFEWKKGIKDSKKP